MFADYHTDFDGVIFALDRLHVELGWILVGLQLLGYSVSNRLLVNVEDFTTEFREGRYVFTHSNG